MQIEYTKELPIIEVYKATRLIGCTKDLVKNHYVKRSILDYCLAPRKKNKYYNRKFKKRIFVVQNDKFLKLIEESKFARKMKVEFMECLKLTKQELKSELNT